MKTISVTFDVVVSENQNETNMVVIKDNIARAVFSLGGSVKNAVVDGMEIAPEAYLTDEQIGEQYEG